MGCGGSKSEILEGCEKPLCHKMECTGIADIDACFETASKNICSIEEMRKLLVDELMDNMFHTGGLVFKVPTPQKAIESCIWRLAVDNKGKVAEIGYNTESLCFEGSCNSEKGNMVANTLCSYMTCLTKLKPEDCKLIADGCMENVEHITSNMEKFMGEIKEANSSNPMKAMSNCNALKVNLAKATCALNCMKELQGRIKMLMECAPEMMASCTPSKLLEQQGCVDKAMKSKQTENLPIAWGVCEIGDRKPKTCKEIEACYGEKVKARCAMIDKINEA